MAAWGVSTTSLLRQIGVSVLFFVIGLAQGYALMYVLLTKDSGFDPEIQVVLGLVLSLFLGVGSAVSTPFRCWCLLTIPSFFGKAGRHVLRAFVITLLIAGPITNMADNGREVVRSFACSARLALNLSRTRWDLVYAPLQRLLLNMKLEKDPLEDVSKEVSAAVQLGRAALGDAPITDDDKTGDRYNRQFRDALTSHCNGILDRAARKCRTAFDESYERCYDAVTFAAAWLLCWPVKLTFICNTVQILGQSGCDPSDVVPADFGATYVALDNASDYLHKESQLGLSYSLKEVQTRIDARGPQEAEGALLHHFQRNKETFDYLMISVRRLLTLVFLKVVFDAQSYQDGYLDDLQFDNRYVTGYFRKVDARRRAKGRATILPLRSSERFKLVDAVSVWPPPNERRPFLLALGFLLVESMAPAALLLLDCLIAQVLDAVHRHGEMSLTQRGHHDLSVRIRGSGLVARLVRKIVKDFQFSARAETRLSNEACLPTVHRLHWSYPARLVACFGGLATLQLLHTHFRRLSRLICATFYPRREKVRVLRAYNAALKHRYGLLRYMRARAVRQARQHQLENKSSALCVRLCSRCPKVCRLVRCPCCAKQCVLCGEVEKRWPEKVEEFFTCSRADCGLHYCPDCWEATGTMCIRCKYLLEATADTDDEGSDASLGLDYPPDAVPP